MLTSKDALTLVLGHGTEVRLGDIGDLRLKLTIARRILRLAAGSEGATPAYVTSAFRNDPFWEPNNPKVEGRD